MIERVKKVILVCDDSTKEYANYLLQLISSKDDKEEIVGIKDGTVDASVWTEKQYLDNKPNMSSKQFVIFFGDSKLVKEETTYMKSKFKMYGMEFSYLGRRAILRVDDKKIDEKAYKNFLNLADSYKVKMKKIKLSPFKEYSGPIAAFPTIDFGNAFNVFSGNAHKAIKRQQYKLLTFITYMEYLNSFFEG